MKIDFAVGDMDNIRLRLNRHLKHGIIHKRDIKLVGAESVNGVVLLLLDIDAVLSPLDAATLKKTYGANANPFGGEGFAEESRVKATVDSLLS